MWFWSDSNIFKYSTSSSLKVMDDCYYCKSIFMNGYTHMILLLLNYIDSCIFLYWIYGNVHFFIYYYFYIKNLADVIDVYAKLWGLLKAPFLNSCLLVGLLIQAYLFNYWLTQFRIANFKRFFRWNLIVFIDQQQYFVFEANQYEVHGSLLTSLLNFLTI